MVRSNWIDRHPTACTCVACQKKAVGTEKVRAAGKVGRNSRCPCGSGKKFKKCHGA